MKTVLLLLLSFGALGAQVRFSTSNNITRYDAETLAWWVNTNFLEAADTNQNGNANPAEVRAWAEDKMVETLNVLIERAKEAREEQDPEALDATYKQALADLAAARAAVKALRRRQ